MGPISVAGVLIMEVEVKGSPLEPSLAILDKIRGGDESGFAKSLAACTEILRSLLERGSEVASTKCAK